jgi:hypothetical protein
MSEIDTSGADKMRQADKVLAAVTAKLEQHRTVLGRCRHGVVTWRFDERGRLEVKFQPTL